MSVKNIFNVLIRLKFNLFCILEVEHTKEHTKNYYREQVHFLSELSAYNSADWSADRSLYFCADKRLVSNFISSFL